MFLQEVTDRISQRISITPRKKWREPTQVGSASIGKVADTPYRWFVWVTSSTPISESTAPLKEKFTFQD